LTLYTGNHRAGNTRSEHPQVDGARFHCPKIDAHAAEGGTSRRMKKYHTGWPGDFRRERSTE